QYSIVKEKFPFSGDLKGLENALETRFSGRLNTLDGIRIDMEKCWIHLRRSNTEPVMRIIAEAGSQEEARGIVEEAGEILKSFSNPST
ncbi:MAG: phosphoglucosamine mutase, partial [Candidatus Krumholzibacteria bacterium]|nr:phosphoglucosamine mutase [Candidatus Krumholzibacteria bacterium]